MALLRSWCFVLAATAIVLTSALSEYPVAATDVKVDKRGYDVKTVFDGNKLGLSIYSIHEDTNGDASVIVLDSTRSSVLRVSLPISQTSVIQRISGSAEGSPGYLDGTTNEALFDHPRKLTLDSDGTIYVADPKNSAVRMITTTGLVTTIAGGTNRTGHNDGEGSEVTFSNDFDVTYLHSTCKLAIADRGNRMVRKIQLPQFIGRCGGATPYPPANPFKSVTLLVFFLVGLVGILVGVMGTILTISTQQLARLQSIFRLATTEDASPLIWTTMKLSSRLQMKEILTTRSFVIRNAAVEHLAWSPALIVEIVITLFEKFLYVLLYSLSLLLRLLCSLPFQKLFHKPGQKTLRNADDETDLLGLHEQANNQPSISRNCSRSLISIFPRVSSMGSLFIRWPCSFQVKNFHLFSPQVEDFLILEDLIDFSESDRSEAQSVDPATLGGINESTPVDVVSNELRMDSMVEKCLADLTAFSPQFS